MTANKLTKRDVLQLLVVSGIAVGVGQLLRSTAPLGRDVSSNATAQAVLADTIAPRSGPADADLTLVVFTDYQCPACRKADPEMRAALAKDQKVRVIYKDWPIFGPVSERAARVAVASNRQGIYHQVHQALMSRGGPLDEAALRDAVDGAGGSWRNVEDYLKGFGSEIDLLLARTSREAFALGIAGTPAYLVGGYLFIGAMTENQFSDTFVQGRGRQR